MWIEDNDGIIVKLDYVNLQERTLWAKKWPLQYYWEMERSKIEDRAFAAMEVVMGQTEARGQLRGWDSQVAKGVLSRLASGLRHGSPAPGCNLVGGS